MAAQRIYIVKTPDGETRLVRANVRSQALSHVAASLLEVRVPTQQELFEAAASGVKVEDFKNPDQKELDL
jgi:hypothetical protein